jgi:DNA-binding MarR family transcriptional regulator
MTAQAQQNAVPEPETEEVGLLPALDQIFAETVALFQRLRAVAPLMHAHAELGQDECTVLQGLDRDGARTITDIAADCDIHRNLGQKLVKALEKQGFVGMIENDEKKKGKLVELTEEGRQLVRSLDQREVELLSSLPLATSPADLQAAARALAAVRQALSNEEWRKLLGNGTGK